jgi:hypothetical protein
MNVTRVVFPRSITGGDTLSTMFVVGEPYASRSPTRGSAACADTDANKATSRAKVYRMGVLT